MRFLSVALLLTFGAAGVRSAVPQAWEAWSQGAQRQLLTDTVSWAAGPGSAPVGHSFPPSLTDTFSSFDSSPNRLETSSTAANQLNEAVALSTVDSTVALVLYSALTSQWGSAAAQATDMSADSLLANFNSALSAERTQFSVTSGQLSTYVQQACEGLATAVDSIPKATSSSKQSAEDAVSGAISSMKGCSAALTRLGYTTSGNNYAKCAAKASTCLANAQKSPSEVDVGCGSTIRATYCGLGL